MAEIKVEPRRGGLGWLWVVIILAIVAAALWYFFSNSRAVSPATPAADSVRTSMGASVPSGSMNLFAWGAENG